MFSMTGFFNDICLVEILFTSTGLYGLDLVRAKSGKNLSVNFIKEARIHPLSFGKG